MRTVGERLFDATGSMKACRDAGGTAASKFAAAVAEAVEEGLLVRGDGTYGGVLVLAAEIAG